MRAAIYEEFGRPLRVENVPDPIPPEGGVVLEVGATGICRSDWHGWMGNDPDIKLPHVPGHELSGTVAEVGAGVRRWKRGDRVTLPFVCGCGSCPECLSGNHQVCDRQFQPGFTHWGAFARYVAVHYADVNLVRLPGEIDFATASSLGCRFITSFRALVGQGRVAPGQWVAVHGCGGVGLSAVMIAGALGANVVAVDVADEKLEFSKSIGAAAAVNSRKTADAVGAVKEITGGGAHVSLDALGSAETCLNSISCLRKRGRHVQVGIMEKDRHLQPIPMNLVIGRELEILGSHGMQAYKFAEMLEMIRRGRLRPERLIGKRISLEAAPEELARMNEFRGTGITVIDEF